MANNAIVARVHAPPSFKTGFDSVSGAAAPYSVRTIRDDPMETSGSRVGLTFCKRDVNRLPLGYLISFVDMALWL